MTNTAQQSFQKYLKEASTAVPDPVAPKIKLKLAGEQLASTPATKFTLKISNKSSPAVTPAPPTNGSNSSNPAANGTSRRNPFNVPQASATPAVVDQLESAKSVSGSAASPSPSIITPAAAVKNEEAARNSPALVGSNGVRSASQASSTPAAASGTAMAPPSTPGLPNLNTYSAAGYAQSFPQPNLEFESKLRQPGQSKSLFPYV